MNYNNYAKVMLAMGLLLTGSLAFAEKNTDLAANVSRAVAVQQMQHKNTTSAVVNLKFDWEKQVRLFDMVHRRHPAAKNVVVKVEKESNECKGVLIEGAYQVVTTAECAHGKSGFSLKQVTLTFANGKTGVGGANVVKVEGDFAKVTVSSSLVKGLNGVQIARVPQGKSLKETFGGNISGALAQFFLSHGVVSARAARLGHTKNTLQKGMPFFYQGKLLAIVRDVPRRFPASVFGGVSEDSLSVFHY